MFQHPPKSLCFVMMQQCENSFNFALVSGVKCAIRSCLVCTLVKSPYVFVVYPVG